jgi:hypothetical protein
MAGSQTLVGVIRTPLFQGLLSENTHFQKIEENCILPLENGWLAHGPHQNRWEGW